MKKKMLILLALGIAIATTVFVYDFYWRKTCEAVVESIKKDFLNDESFYDELIALVLKIGISEDYAVYYDYDMHSTVVETYTSNELHAIDSQILLSLNAKFEAMRYFPYGVRVIYDEKKIYLTDLIKDGLGSYRGIDLIFYESPPSEVRGKQLSTHWYLWEWHPDM